MYTQTCSLDKHITKCISSNTLVYTFFCQKLNDATTTPSYIIPAKSLFWNSDVMCSCFWQPLNMCTVTERQRMKKSELTACKEVFVRSSNNLDMERNYS
jgi:hypothetical protein